MQGQLANIQQFCMAVNQQPPPTIYAPPQQQQLNKRRDRRNGGYGGGNGGGSFPQQPTWFGGNGAGAQQPARPPTPYKRWENWNYCHTHGGDIDDTHTSTLCNKRSPTHNPNATRANMMGGSIPGMHKTILPLVCGRTPPPPSHPQQQQRPQQRPPVSYYPIQGTNDATGQWHVPCAGNHAYAGEAAWSRHDEFCRTAVPSTRNRADDAAISPAGDAHDCTLLRSLPAQPYYAPNQQQQPGYF